MIVDIDKYAGFCFGVTKAILAAERELSVNKSAFCLGKIVHNQQEENRLKSLGLNSISYDYLAYEKPQRLIIRAHGEPPSTYLLAKQNNIHVIDETCPVVLKLQGKIADSYAECTDAQIVIFGKKGHAEVNGLVGRINGDALVVNDLLDVANIDFSKKIILFSQTTADYGEFEKIVSAIQDKLVEINGDDKKLVVHETICASVKNRIPRLQEFCRIYELIIFVSDKSSSNGEMLYDVCRKESKKTYFVTSVNDLKRDWFINIKSVGISGATSTPQWLLDEVKKKISEMENA